MRFLFKIAIKLYLFLLIIILCIFIYVKYIRQEYYIYFSDMKLGVCYPTNCYELKYPLDTIYKINKFKIPYKNGCGGHISSPSYIETSYDKIENICKLTIGSILRALDIHDKHSADYYSRRDGECLQSPLFGILPSEGTYLINYEYFEIKDDCWSHVIPISGHVYDYHLYTLKDTGKNKDILKLSPEDFELVHKKQITKPEIETLPFGTYLMMSTRKFGNAEYFIVSIKKAD